MKDLAKRYSFGKLLSMMVSVIRTKLIFRQARIIRFPVDLRGRKYISVKKGFTTGTYCRLEAYPMNEDVVLFFGENVQMNDFVHITAMNKVVIGNNVLMASKIYISDCSHGSYANDEFDSNPLVSPIDRQMFAKEVIIKDNAWLGESVSVLPGVTIGKGSIIGANSVVTHDIPDFVIAVGIPAKPIKKYNFETRRWEKLN